MTGDDSLRARLAAIDPARPGAAALSATNVSRVRRVRQLAAESLLDGLLHTHTRTWPSMISAILRSPNSGTM
jgi:hypothetical protein